MKVVVLGGGVIGVTTAYALARSGCEVTLIDRRSEVGLETSFANAGEITPSGASPWASPRLPWLVAKWLLKADGPLKIRPTAGLKAWRWTARLLAECSAERFDANRKRLVRLANYSRDQLRLVREQTALDYDARTLGVLHLFQNEIDLEQAARDAPALAAMGVPYERLDWSGCVAIEPGLGHAQQPWAGGLRFSDDETGDCLKFTQGLARLAVDEGVTLALNRDIERLEVEGDKVVAAVTRDGPIRADAFVLSLGSWSPRLGRSLGVDIPVQPVKGYSLTLPVLDPDRAPVASIMDEERKVAITRLGSRVRVAGMAELAGFNADLPVRRMRTLKKVVSDLFPGATGDQEDSFWCGFRPTTPDGAPILGHGPLRNLYLNTGHGTLGWTMACGSARIIADIVQDKTPEIEASDLTIDRFG